MTTWEYRRTFYTAEGEMRRMGSEGWELVAVTSTPSGEPGYFFWKRPLERREAAA